MSPGILDVLLAELDRDVTALDALAHRLAPQLRRMLPQETSGTPWLNAEDAAAYIAASRGRIYDLVQLGKLQPRRDGKRLLFRREDLDSYLEDQ